MYAAESCSALLPVAAAQVWDVSQPQAPLMSFDLGAAVGDIAWAPYSSTVFAAVTDDGKVHVFDLAQNRQLPLCAQKVSSTLHTGLHLQSWCAARSVMV
jgi:dynein intermediate chain 1